MSFERDVAIIGGCGRVGVPLGIVFASRGLKVVLYDVAFEAVDQINRGQLPFEEPGAKELFEPVRAEGKLVATTDPGEVGSCESVVVVIGTPVDEHLNPDPEAIPRALEELAGKLVDGQLLVLRSTVYPGVTALVEKLIARLGLEIDVSFCPERIAEGRAIRELMDLPQIVAGRTPRAAERAERLFRHLNDTILQMTPEEAELAKLFTNTWRYIKFATANQLYMIANDYGLDFEKIRSAIVHEYPRAADMPGAGFAAGPCLLKDTMQLAAFNNNNFVLGQASMMINEGLPLYLVARLERNYDLSRMTVGILGMAFKADSDDIRSSLSYKLKRLLRFKSKEVLCTDPYVKGDRELLPLAEVLSRADLLFLGAPHRVYAELKTDKPVVDIWGLLGKGVRV